MKNKYGVKISKAERKYFNSLKQSIRRVSKDVSLTLKEYQPVSYLKRKTNNNFTPVIKKSTVHTFKSREDFLKEVESLAKIKTDLSTYKPRKPSQYEELPKRLQKTYDDEVRKYTRTSSQRVRIPRSHKRNISKLLNLSFINKRNDTYRTNMILAIRKVFEPEIAIELSNALLNMTEAQFLKFFLSRPNETISYVYHNPHGVDVKQLDLMRAIVNASS